MALKAGLVGVNPKGVDKNGMPIATGETVDAYSKSETDTLLAAKADKSTLTANSKEFNFAYDTTTEKYGYKAGADGDFVPFDSGAAGGVGWVAPDDLSATGLTTSTGMTIDEGGYTEKDGIIIVDIVLHSTSGSGYLDGFPLPKGSSSIAFVRCEGNNAAGAKAAQPTYYATCSTSGHMTGNFNANTYYRVYGQYEKKTS